MSNISIIEALEDPKVFGPFFKGSTWDSWKAFLAALFALPMTPEQLAIYRKHTGRTTPPAEPLHEAWLCIGRRGGKSFVLATIAVYLACFHDWRKYLNVGERGTIMIIARDRRQARVIKRYISGLLGEVPMLAPLVELDVAETIELRNRISIEIHTASFRSTRGYTIVAALLDEVAFWPTDETSAEPDREVLTAIRPAMSTIPGAMLLCASSPYARRGALFDAHQKHFGKDGDPVLVWQAATRDMNASVPQAFVDQQYADDRASAQAEYGAVFRTDREAYVQREAIAACVGDHFEIGPADHSYQMFSDPAGGAGQDSFTACVAHGEGKLAIIDAVREYPPPFSPEAVVAELAPLAKAYGCSKIVGDRWGGLFPAEAFRKHGISYEQCKVIKSDLYRDLLPLLNSRRIVLPRHDKLFNQIISLERHAVRGGHDTIDHPSGAHDDLANSVAGAASLIAFNTASLFGPDSHWLDDGPEADAKPSDTANQTYSELQAAGGAAAQVMDEWTRRQVETPEEAEARAKAAAAANADNQAFQQRQYFMEHLMPGGTSAREIYASRGRQINWAAMPSMRDQLYRR